MTGWRFVANGMAGRAGEDPSEVNGGSALGSLLSALAVMRLGCIELEAWRRAIG